MVYTLTYVLKAVIAKRCYGHAPSQRAFTSRGLLWHPYALETSALTVYMVCTWLTDFAQHTSSINIPQTEEADYEVNSTSRKNNHGAKELKIDILICLLDTWKTTQQRGMPGFHGLEAITHRQAQS